jgi:tRNA(fMet)-specific endonuclease VapC
VSRHMLDTNICVYLLRGTRHAGTRWMERHDLEEVFISSITLAELLYGVWKSNDPARNQAAVVDFCSALEVASFNDRAAAMYGPIRAQLEQTGRPIGPLDMLIAAHALAIDATLVTNNEREFRRVANLRVETWRPPPR